MQTDYVLVFALGEYINLNTKVFQVCFIVYINFLHSRIYGTLLVTSLQQYFNILTVFI